MFLRIASVTTAAAAALAVGVGAPGVAFAAPAPPPPSLAGTTQTLTTLVQGTSNTRTIVFAAKKWQFQGTDVSGRWIQVNKHVGITTYSTDEKGCSYSGTYNATSGIYSGQYACQTNEPDGTFTLTTGGATD